MPQSGISENPKLFWYSPSRCILPCNRSGNNLYGFVYITSAISRGLWDYTAVLGKAGVFEKDGGSHKAGDIWFESTDPRKAEHILLLPETASESSSDSYEEAETQRNSLMYAVNDDSNWGCKKYILLEIEYRYTEQAEAMYCEANANYYRKLATAELILTGHCPEDLANEFFPGLTRDEVVNGCLLTKTFGKQTIGNVAKAYYVIGANGDTIRATMYRNYDNGEREQLWLDIPDSALVICCNSNPDKDMLDVSSIQGQVRTATKEQRSVVAGIINNWMATE